MIRLKVRKIRLPTSASASLGQTFGPPSKHHEYLGTVIAYRDARARTAAHRLKKGQRSVYSPARNH